MMMIKRSSSSPNFPLSAQEQTEKELVEEVKKASVICIVYSVDNEVSIDKVSVEVVALVFQFC